MKTVVTCFPEDGRTDETMTDETTTDADQETAEQKPDATESEPAADAAEGGSED